MTTIWLLHITCAPPDSLKPTSPANVTSVSLLNPVTHRHCVARGDSLLTQSPPSRLAATRFWSRVYQATPWATEPGTDMTLLVAPQPHATNGLRFAFRVLLQLAAIAQAPFPYLPPMIAWTDFLAAAWAPLGVADIPLHPTLLLALFYPRRHQPVHVQPPTPPPTSKTAVYASQPLSRSRSRLAYRSWRKRKGGKRTAQDEAINPDFPDRDDDGYSRDAHDTIALVQGLVTRHAPAHVASTWSSARLLGMRDLANLDREYLLALALVMLLVHLHEYGRVHGCEAPRRRTTRALQDLGDSQRGNFSVARLQLQETHCPPVSGLRSESGAYDVPPLIWWPQLPRILDGGLRDRFLPRASTPTLANSWYAMLMAFPGTARLGTRPSWGWCVPLWHPRVSQALLVLDSGPLVYPRALVRLGPPSGLLDDTKALTSQGYGLDWLPGATLPWDRAVTGAGAAAAGNLPVLHREGCWCARGQPDRWDPILFRRPSAAIKEPGVYCPVCVPATDLVTWSRAATALSSP